MEPAAKADNKKGKMVIGGVVASLLIVSVIIIAVTTGGKTADGGSGGSDVDPIDFECYNPMCALFLMKPNF